MKVAELETIIKDQINLVLESKKETGFVSYNTAIEKKGKGFLLTQGSGDKLQSIVLSKAMLENLVDKSKEL